jgi:hypothetical protein
MTLNALVPGVRWTEDHIMASYEYRSGIAHGLGMGVKGITKKAQSVYLRTERGARRILEAAILDPAIAEIFASDDSIRQWL